jgi:hypothetical protein
LVQRPARWEGLYKEEVPPRLQATRRGTVAPYKEEVFRALVDALPRWWILYEGPVFRRRPLTPSTRKKNPSKGSTAYPVLPTPLAPQSLPVPILFRKVGILGQR